MHTHTYTHTTHTCARISSCVLKSTILTITNTVKRKCNPKINRLDWDISIYDGGYNPIEGDGIGIGDKVIVVVSIIVKVECHKKNVYPLYYYIHRGGKSMV